MLIPTNNMHIWYLLFLWACNYAVLDSVVSVASHQWEELGVIYYLIYVIQPMSDRVHDEKLQE